jgi:hypothetical protein
MSAQSWSREANALYTTRSSAEQVRRDSPLGSIQGVARRTARASNSNAPSATSKPTPLLADNTNSARQRQGHPAAAT